MLEGRGMREKGALGLCRNAAGEACFGHGKAIAFQEILYRSGRAWNPCDFWTAVAVAWHGVECFGRALGSFLIFVNGRGMRRCVVHDPRYWEGKTLWGFLERCLWKGVYRKGFVERCL